jgi:glyoxylase-like metal-dependent hydrolase (beta-lactamase superfamily II)
VNVAVTEIEEAYSSPPPFAEMVEVVPRLYWVRLPLSGLINHVNSWLLDDGDGWTLIDFGTDTDPIRDAWARLFDGPLKGKRINRLVLTHGHSDHIGHAGVLARSLRQPVIGTRTEWLAAGFRRGEAIGDLPAYVAPFFARHDCGPEHVETYDAARRRMANEVAELPPLIRIRRGDTLTMAGRLWAVMIARGHSPEHVSFWCEAEHLLIAGDQVLPRTSPTLGIIPSEPEADPLGEYLGSLAQFEELPDDAYVLTSHGIPYRGLKHRVRQLRAHHRQRLERVRAAMDGPKTATEVAHVVYAKAMTDGRARFGFNEALARLNHLVREKAVTRVLGEDGRERFVPSPGKSNIG